jgi:hypothetical protein
VAAADDRRDAQAAPLKQLGHLDRHDVAAAGADHQGRVLRRQVEIPQDPLGQPAHVFEEHRLPLPVGADDGVVKRQ